MAKQYVARALMLSVPAALLLVACETTKPLDGAGIDYRLPKTDAIAQLALTLRQCRDDGFDVDADLAVVAKVGAGDTVYHVPGSVLGSARIKRDLQIGVSDDGVLTGINSASADQTPAIIGNALKTAAILLPLAAGAPRFAGEARRSGPPGLQCLPDVTEATLRAPVIEKQIHYLRQQLALSSPGSGPTPADLQRLKELNTLARELASLRTGILRIETAAPIKLGNDQSPTNQSLKLKLSSFEKWFGPKPSEATIAEHFGLEWKSERKTTKPETLIATGGSEPSRECGLAVTVPNVAVANVTVLPTGKALKPVIDKDGASEAFPVAQWNPPNKLCIDVGVGESRSVVLAFDKYGRTKDFHWSTEATAATVSGAVSGAAGDFATLVKTARGPSELDRQKAQIEALETQKKLNELIACQAIIEAGGFKCDSSSDDN